MSFKFRTPDGLSSTPTEAKRILVIGGCLSEAIYGQAVTAFPGVEVDHILFNQGELPEAPLPLENYAFQVVLMPLRAVAPEQMHREHSHETQADFEKSLDVSCGLMTSILDAAMAYNRKSKILTFVAEFLTPQQNMMGRLLPRYDLRNPVYYVEEINRALHMAVSRYDNAFAIPLNEIASTFGRRHIQDDMLYAWSHGSLANDWDYAYDTRRIQQPKKLSELFELNTIDFTRAIWAEIAAMYRTVKQQDAVKLVIIDLDDTLWRGVIVEEGITATTIEGWPIGLIEALNALKRRGVLLAIASKNDDAKVSALWHDLLNNRIGMDDFATRRINWNPKVGNILEIIADANVLPKNVVFIDDNPVERAAVKEAIPDIRVLGEDLYDVRRQLLWSSETQVPYITKESAARTEMIQAQIRREGDRVAMSREEFLANLNISIAVNPIADTGDSRFKRAFELLNKTNQFNTTGKRWTLEEAAAAFKRGVVFHSFEVQDKYSQYGLVGVAIVDGAHISQFVMSCRVIGLGVENAVIAFLIESAGVKSAAYTETAANGLCRDLYSKTGFVEINGIWTIGESAPPIPQHIQMAA